MVPQLVLSSSKPACYFRSGDLRGMWQHRFGSARHTCPIVFALVHWMVWATGSSVLLVPTQLQCIFALGGGQGFGSSARSRRQSRRWCGLCQVWCFRRDAILFLEKSDW